VGRRPLEPIESPYDHGTASCYRYGCGCRPCLDAHSQALRDYKERRADQLQLFPDDPTKPGLLGERKRLPQMPPGVDLSAVAAALADPDPHWANRARCKGNQRISDVFHEVVVVQIRHDGTKAYSAPGDFVPEGYQRWCAGCPVWAECIADALRVERIGPGLTSYRAGFWGSTPTQRKNIDAALATLEVAAS
jgi:hypothetical protein